MNTYAQPGLPALANQIQAQGRGEDKVLVHMTPSEVKGLQYLAMSHGGSLTVNPRTGLVEAGFLSSILPMVAGAALAATGVGAPMAALLVGGGYGLATGSLSKGIMAGLGAFGGAGLASGLSAAGATAPAVTGTQAGLTSAGEMAASNLAPEALNAASYGEVVGAGMQSPAFQAAQSNIDPGLLEGAYGTTPMTAEQVVNARVLNATPGVVPPQPAGGLDQMTQGFKNIFATGTEGEQARQAFLGTPATKTAEATGVGGIPGLIKYGGAAAAPMMASMTGPDESVGGPDTQEYIRPFTYDPGRQDVAYRTGRPGESTSEQLYFSPRYTPLGVYKPENAPAYGTYAKGGDVESEDGFDIDLNMNVGKNAAYSDAFYGGGLTALARGGKPATPRFLVGKGDGMSDSIPATINEVQPARLADGEFVIPADVVSHLGNGSSKAGADKLHAMMNRIRKARTGKKRQAPEVKAERYMPA